MTARGGVLRLGFAKLLEHPQKFWRDRRNGRICRRQPGARQQSQYQANFLHGSLLQYNKPRIRSWPERSTRPEALKNRKIYMLYSPSFHTLRLNAGFSMWQGDPLFVIAVVGANG